MYLGVSVLTLGIAFYAGTLPLLRRAILLFLLCNFVFHVPSRRPKMQRQFHDQYTDYLRRVRDGYSVRWPVSRVLFPAFKPGDGHSSGRCVAGTPHRPTPDGSAETREFRP